MNDFSISSAPPWAISIDKHNVDRSQHANKNVTCDTMREEEKGPVQGSLKGRQ